MVMYDSQGNLIKINSDEYFNVLHPTYSNLFSAARDGYMDNVKLGGQGRTIALAGSTTSGFIDISDYKGKYIIPQYATVREVNPEMVLNTFPYYTYLEFYDENKDYIEPLYADASVTRPYTTPRNPVLIPQNASYVRCAWNISYNGVRTCELWQFGVFIVDAADGTIPFEPFYSEGTPKSVYLRQNNFRFSDAPLLYGKKWTLFGDSLTDSFGGHDWQKSSYSKGEYGTIGDETDVPWTDYFFASKIAREFGLTIDNRAKAGSNMCIPLASQWVSVAGINILNEFIAEIDAETVEQPDIITIAFGTNAYDNYIGTDADDSTVTTASYYGATKYFIEKLREKCPKSAFGFVLPPVADWVNDSGKQAGVPLARIAIKTVCEEYGVPFIDMSKESGITADMLPDGVHISSHQANNLYYHAMRRFVMGL